jgi:hypothetical protein
MRSLAFGNSLALPVATSMPPVATRVYPKGMLPRCRPYGANAFDDCLEAEYKWWEQFMAAGGLCNQTQRKYNSPPWVSMPSEGRRFRPIESTPLSAFQVPGPAFNGLDTVVLQMRVPLGYDGVISDVVFSFGGSGFIEGSGDITWRLAADYLPAGGGSTDVTGGRYLRDMGNVTTSLGSLVQPSPVPRGGLRIYSNDLVTIICNIAVAATAANGNIITSISGWTWPR